MNARLAQLRAIAVGGSARRGFTLTELLVTMGIIVVLMSLIVPTAKTFQAESRSLVCSNNLRQLWSSIESYRTSNRDFLPMCEFLPVVTDQGAQGGLPELLKAYVPKDCTCWQCAADFDEDGSLSTGTSYLYVPGLIRYTPQVQIQVQQAMVPFIVNPGTSLSMLEKFRREAEAKLVTRFYESSPDFAVLCDSQDRHNYGDRQPKNAVFLDGRTGRVIFDSEASPPPAEPGNGSED
jgi:prepilin-type N-terminal cleavage/methylation domain-containing protein